MDTKTVLRNKINAGNYKTSKQRLITLDELKKVTSHPSADEVYRMVRKKIRNISLGTIYRNLRILGDLGLIQVLNYGNRFCRYDGNPDNHYHISCERCGRVDDIPIGIWKRLDSEVALATSYEVKTHRIEFFGLCRECKSKEVIK